jgi:hypothetical protein
MFTLAEDAFRDGHLVRMYMDTPYAHWPYTCGKWFDEEQLAAVTHETIVALYAAELHASKVVGPRRASAV